MRELLRQLQERHVLRTAVLYLGAGWVALEFLGFVVNNYSLDRALLDIGLLLAATGFAITLIVSWFHGKGGRQPVPRVERAAIATLLVFAGVGSAMLATRDRPEPRSLTLAPAGIVPADLGEGSLAVLPLTNRSGTDTLEWMGPGLADMLATNLAQIRGLRVVSAQRLLDLMRQAGRGETEEIPDDLALRIAAQSGARTLVRGSFTVVGDQVRLDVQLIELQDGTITAADRSRGADVFALVDEVSARLSSHLLGEQVAPTELTPVSALATADLEAYRAYQEGLLAERRFLNERARTLYRQAVERDSTFAIAWLRLAIQANTGQEALQAFQNADRFKERASERDRYTIEAMIAGFLQHDLGKAERRFTELIERYPDEKEGRYQLGVLYDGEGRSEEARRIIEEAVALDPFYAPGINHLAYLAGRRGDTLAADTLSLRYLALEPAQANPHDSRGEILEMIGRPLEAKSAFLAALGLEPAFLPAYQHLVRSYLRDGDAEGARAALVPFLDVQIPEALVMVGQLLGDTYVAEGRYAAAIAAYRAAAGRAAELERSDLRLPPLLEAARLTTLTGSFDEAEDLYHQGHTIDPFQVATMFGLLMVSGERGDIGRMRAVRDSAARLFATAPPVVRQQADLPLRRADATIAWYRGEAATAVAGYDESRTLAGIPRPTPLPGVEPETLALIEVGRAREALDLAEDLEKRAMYQNRLSPLDLQVALYLEGRAHEALGHKEEAIGSYERLLQMTGQGVRDLLYLRDMPQRLTALRRSRARGAGDPG